jgi:acetyl esterase
MTQPLDPAFEKLLADPRVELRRPGPDISIVQVRAVANDFLARAPRPPVHAVKDVGIVTGAGLLQLRLYRPSEDPHLPLVLFIHGGGFILGDLESHDAMARTIANEAGAVVAAVEYRLAPENPFPAAIEDCSAALLWLVQAADEFGIDPGRIALVGDSAGGQLAIAIALLCHGDGLQLSHLGLLYPLLDPDRRSESAQTLATGFMLSGSFIDWAWEAYAGGARRDNPLFDLARSPVEGLPPTTIITAEYDPLRDEGEAFAMRLRYAGVPVEIHRFDAMIHGFAGMPQLTALAGEALSLLGDRVGGSLAR